LRRLNWGCGDWIESLAYHRVALAGAGRARHAVSSWAGRPSLFAVVRTAHHLVFPRYSADVVRRELVDNLETLESITDRPVPSLSYPYGVCDWATADIADQLGFSTALSADPGCITRDSDPLRLPRLEISARSADDLEFEPERLFEQM